MRPDVKIRNCRFDGDWYYCPNRYVCQLFANQWRLGVTMSSESELITNLMLHGY